MRFIRLDPKTGIYHFRLPDGTALLLCSNAAFDITFEQKEEEINKLKAYITKRGHLPSCAKGVLLKDTGKIGKCSCGFDEVMEGGK